MSPFPEMTFRFPPFYKFFGKDIMRLGRGGRKFESCRLDEDETPGNVEKSRLPGIFSLVRLAAHVSKYGGHAACLW